MSDADDWARRVTNLEWLLAEVERLTAELAEADKLLRVHEATDDARLAAAEAREKLWWAIASGLRADAYEEALATPDGGRSGWALGDPFQWVECLDELDRRCGVLMELDSDGVRDE